MANGRESILVVDCEETTRQYLCETLSNEGYHCRETGSAEQALKELAQQTADLVMLDSKILYKSGGDLLSELKVMYPGTAIVMITAHTDTDLDSECTRNGVQEYIYKPYSLNEVLQSVRRVLDNWKLELDNRRDKLRLEQQVEEQVKEIRKLFLVAIESLIFTLEAKDRYTAGHSRRVTELAMHIGHQLGLPQDDLEDLRWGSLLHDIGNIAIDQATQNKHRKLTVGEYSGIMFHTRIGPEIIRPVANDKVVELIRHHHDFYNGSGLDQNATGENIPLGARIIAVADAFVAMTSERPYRQAIDEKQALIEIACCSGTQFDPKVVNAFFEVLAPEETKMPA